MKKAIIIPLISVLLTLGLLVGCGPMRTQTYDYTGFTRVDVGYAFRVEITQSDSYSISITAPENLFNVIQVSKEGQALKIGLTIRPTDVFDAATQDTGAYRLSPQRGELDL